MTKANLISSKPIDDYVNFGDRIWQGFVRYSSNKAYEYVLCPPLLGTIRVVNNFFEFGVDGDIGSPEHLETIFVKEISLIAASLLDSKNKILLDRTDVMIFEDADNRYSINWRGAISGVPAIKEISNAN